MQENVAAANPSRQQRPIATALASTWAGYPLLVKKPPKSALIKPLSIS